MPGRHASRVAAVARQIATRSADSKVTLRKATPTHSIRGQAYERGLHVVDVSALDQILEINTERCVVRAEEQVTMGQLAAATLARGFVPAVGPEFRKFTVSGLGNGEGIQSSSHLRDKVVWVDPATPDPGKIPFWRLQRTYGPRWYFNPVTYVLLAVGFVSRAIWRTPAGIR